MSSLNMVALVGNVGKEPRFFPPKGGDGSAVAKFSIATNEFVKKEKTTEWNREDVPRIKYRTFGKLVQENVAISLRRFFFPPGYKDVPTRHHPVRSATAGVPTKTCLVLI